MYSIVRVVVPLVPAMVEGMMVEGSLGIVFLVITRDLTQMVLHAADMSRLAHPQIIRQRIQTTTQDTTPVLLTTNASW